MSPYQPATGDLSFLLFKVLQAGDTLKPLPVFAEVDEPLLSQVLEEAARFVGEVLSLIHI